MNGIHYRVLVAALSFWGHVGTRAGEDPGADWLGVYGWIQTADQLAAAEQWPLALGSYLEASRRLEALIATHPEFEPEMVTYRRESLAETLATSEARLTTDEHEVMMKYLDFIESMELGETQRYQNEFEAAFGTLGMAKALLEEIIDIKPAGFREAVASQYDRLTSEIAWLDSQIHVKEVSRPAVVLDETIDWGTTRFVKTQDLPAAGKAAPLASDLFPAALVPPLDPGTDGKIAPEPAATPGTPAPAPASSPPPGPRRFRMSSRPSASPTAPAAGDTPAIAP